MSTLSITYADLEPRAQALLAGIPEPYQGQAAALLALYGPQFFAMAVADARVFLSRLLAGDLMATVEIHARFTGAEFLAHVAENTARWEGVANYNRVRDDMLKEFALRVASAMIFLLLAFVGL